MALSGFTITAFGALSALLANMSGKGQRYDQKVLEKWFKEPKLTVFEKFSDTEVKCLVCSRDTVLPVLINIKSRGKAMLTRHVETEKHCQIAAKPKESYCPLQMNLEQCVSKNKQVCIIELSYLLYYIIF